MVKRLTLCLFRLLLPLALLLAQHGVWAHGFAHDQAKIAAHGQIQDHASHACCLPFQAAGDVACGAAPFEASATAVAAICIVPGIGRLAPTHLPYSSRAPPLTS